MGKNTGASFEEEVFISINNLVEKNKFMVSEPNVRVCKKPRYYSKDRDAEIEFDISVEKYLGNPDEDNKLRPSIIVIIECKDYSTNIPVDDVEEFHAKLQQIGADNTKGIMITKNGNFQKSALTYADTKGIALARLLPDHQVNFVEYRMRPILKMNYNLKKKKNINIMPLIKKGYISVNDGYFFSSTGEDSLEELIVRFL